MTNTSYTIAEDPVLKYKHIDPIPSAKDVEEFYKNKYYEMISDGTGKPEQLSRMLDKNKSESDKERLWLQKTTYSDILDVIKKRAPGKKVLDIGCGTGDVMKLLLNNGIDACGLDPSTYAIEVAKANGCTNVHNCSIDDFYKQNIEKFDAIVLVNVLEHVPDPKGLISMVNNMLVDNGIVVIVVPNDFSRIQALAKRWLKRSDDWWVAMPDHINYFNHASLKFFMEKLGFTKLHLQGDFPMELFLLAGFCYLGNRDIGKKCHSLRVKAEMLLPNPVRRFFYTILAKLGLGRDSFYVGKKV